LQPIKHSDLDPDAYYWALRDPFLSEREEELEIVQVSTVFGATPEHLSVAVFGSEQHYSLRDFVFFQKIDRLYSIPR
jgi:hypothetical protein